MTHETDQSYVIPIPDGILLHELQLMNAIDFLMSLADDKERDRIATWIAEKY